MSYRLASSGGQCPARRASGPARVQKGVERMRRISVLLAVVASFVAATATMAAAPLQTFGTGSVTVSGSSATIVNDAGEYGGVYIKARSINNKLVGDVTVSFMSTGDVTGGAPRFNLPIDNDGDRQWDYWLTLDAANCGGTSDVATWVSTENPDCVVYFLGDEAPAASYPNYDAFVAANPTHRIASKGDSSIPFIIADIGPGEYVVEGIDLQ